MAGARKALSGLGLSIAQERDVVTVDMEDNPGELGKISRKIANAGININMVYMGTNSRLVIAAYDIDNAKAALE